MIQPTALPTAPALAPGGVALAASPEGAETGAEFAALLGLQLDANATGETPYKTVGATLAPVVPQSGGNTEDKPLPGALPVAAPVTEEATAHAAEKCDDDPTALIVALPHLQITPPAEAPAPTQDASARTPVPMPLSHPKTLVTEASDNPMPAQPTARPEGKVGTVPAVHSPTLPRLTLSAAEERARAVSAESIRAVTSAPDGEASPSLTVPSLPIFTMPQTLPTATATTAQAPRDFATLVDRLVEARETARAVQTPQGISASIAHAEFGEVSIRFEHGGDALSVALSNPDPEFTRAVQAAAPLAQTSTRDDNGAQPGRQDAPGQQAGTSSGHSPQSQPQQRQSGTLARNPAARERGMDEEQGHGGIFA